SRVENAPTGPAGRIKTAESDAEGEAQVGRGGFGVKLLDVLGERRAVETVDGGLCPVLSAAPRGGAGIAELNGWFTVGFVNTKGGTDLTPDCRRRSVAKDWNSKSIAGHK